MSNSIVGLKELRENLETYAAQVKKGRSFVVLKKSRPIFKISPVEEDDSLWETIIDFTRIKKGGVPISELLSRLWYMDKISKSLSKLTPKEQKQVKSILARLNRGDKSGLDIKKLKGREDIFRIRKGNIRIIYKTDKKSIFVLAIERRNDTTYSF